MTHRTALSMPEDLGRTLSMLHAAHPYLRRHALLRLAVRAGLEEIAALSPEELRDRAATEVVRSLLKQDE